jgi:serine/threonine-protein kinase RsbW
MTFKLEFVSELEQVKSALAEFMEYLKSAFPGAEKETVYEVRLILSELLYNAVIHGNKRDKTKAVLIEAKAEAEVRAEVRAEAGDGFLCCYVTDQGSGFDYESVIKNHSTNPDKCLESDHGRGVRLARCLADELKYIPPGNKVRFKKRVVTYG